ncbi:MAG: CcmD family protein [Saprospiraceae bacterium]
MLVLPFQLAAQDGADYSRSIGKIYVVVAVILVIFLGIVIYLISLDRKISKLEKRIDNE